MNPNDPHNTTETDLTTGETTLTGEQGAPPVPPVVREKNKGNLVLFTVLGVLVVAVLGAGYVAFGKHKAPPARAPAALTAAVHKNPAPTAQPAPVTPLGTAPSPEASSPVPVITQTTQTTQTKLATPDEAQALLGGTPAPVVLQPPAPSALPTNPAVQQGVNELPSAVSAVPNANPSVLGSPSVGEPVPSALGLTPANPSVLTTPPSAASVAVVSTTPDANPIVLTPAPVVEASATPVTMAPSDTALDLRVTHLEDRLGSLEAGQTRILDLLASRRLAVRHAAATHVPAPSTSPVVHRHARHHVTPINTVELVKDKPATESKRAMPAGRPMESCHLASIVPNRAWTKQADGSFLTYGVGDRAPNGSVIKSIDPDAGIITAKGKLNCAMTD